MRDVEHGSSQLIVNLVATLQKVVNEPDLHSPTSLSSNKMELSVWYHFSFFLRLGFYSVRI